MANNYKVKMVDLQNKYKFKIFCSSQMYDDTDLKREVEAIYKAFPKASATGTSATLTGTAAALMNIDLKGNGGNNLLPQDKYIPTRTINGITYTNNGDGTFNLTGTATANTTLAIVPIGDLKLEANQPYYLYSSVPYNATTFNMSIVLSDGGATRFITANNTYTSTATPTNERLQFYIASGKSVDQTNIKLMLVKGTTAPTDYEPYDASVTGDNTINICGKNLLDIDNWVKGRINVNTGQIEYADNTTSMIINDNSITFTVSQAWNSGIASGFIPISTGNYVFTYSHDREISMYINTYDANKTYIERIDAYTQTATPTTRTFTISNANVKYIRIHFAVNTATTYVVSNMQVEKGSTATTYEPYTGKSYPINLGSTKLKTGDSIQGTKNKWNIVRADGTTEAIADATLISQLNNLRYNAESYEGQTNISQVNNDLPFIITASAIKDLSNL